MTEVDCGKEGWGKCECSRSKREKINTETNMVDWTRGVYLELCRERKQTEAEPAALTTHTHISGHKCADFLTHTNSSSDTRTPPHAHVVHDERILTLNKLKQEIGGTESF